MTSLRTIRAKLGVAFLVVNLLALLIAGTGIFGLADVSSSILSFQDRAADMASIRGVITSVEKMHNAQLQLIYQNNQRAISRFTEASELARADMEQIERAGKTNTEQVLLYLLEKELSAYDQMFQVEMVPTWQSYQASIQSTTVTSLNNASIDDEQFANHLYLYESQIQHLEGQMATVQSRIDKVVFHLIQLFEVDNSRVSDNLHQVVSLTRTTMIVATTTAILLGLLISFFYSRHLTQPIAELVQLAGDASRGNLLVRSKIQRSDELGTLSKGFNHMVEEMKNLAGQVKLSTGTVDQSLHTLQENTRDLQNASTHIVLAIKQVTAGDEQATDRLVQINQNLSDIVENINGVTTEVVEVSTITNHSNDIAKSGLTSMTELNQQMQKVQEVFQLTVEKMQAFTQRNQEINTILRLIREIVEQTNLLSLNASIEAARAGEHGRGFAVVAEEIRKLSSQSETATQEIATILQTIQVETETISQLMQKGKIEVEQGTNQASHFSLNMQEMADQFSDLDDNMKNISTKTEMVRGQSNDILQTVTTIVKMVEENMAATEEIRANTEEQLQLSDQTVKVFSQLDQNFEGLKAAIASFKTTEEGEHEN